MALVRARTVPATGNPFTNVERNRLPELGSCPSNRHVNSECTRKGTTVHHIAMNALAALPRLRTRLYTLYNP